jgi:hypothetical protein
LLDGKQGIDPVRYTAETSVYSPPALGRPVYDRHVFGSGGVIAVVLATGDDLDIFIPLVVVILFPLLWYGVSLLLAKLSGWDKLADRYKRDDSVPASGIKMFHLRSGFVGSVNYKSCLSIGISDHGLMLAVFFPFRIGHPPLCIPWHEFSRVSERRGMLYSTTIAAVGRPTIVQLTLPGWVRSYMLALGKMN